MRPPHANLARRAAGLLLLQASSPVATLGRCVDGWSVQSNLFGYAVTSSMKWEGGVIHTENVIHAMEDSGKGEATRVTTSLHYVDDHGELVNESISGGIAYKTWFSPQQAQQPQM